MHLGRNEKVRIVRAKPLVGPRLRGKDDREITLEHCVMDTGCPHSIILPSSYADRVKILSSQSWSGDVYLPNGTRIPFTTFLGEVKWLCGSWRPTVIRIVKSFQHPLLGLPLLRQSFIALRRDTGHVRPRWWLVSEDVVES